MQRQLSTTCERWCIGRMKNTPGTGKHHLQRQLSTTCERFCIGRMKNTASAGKHHLQRTPMVKVEAKDIRNIGKTTTTERILYLAGATSFMGDVDTGSTVTDFMDIERERGITIQSAAVTLFWRQHRINLIDTPGHVDFTLERCVRVLDGAVTILDGSAGVQAQTHTVWRQAAKYELPSVVFVNKMDKPGANFEHCCNDVERKLKQIPLPISRPVLFEGRLDGLIDIVGGKYLSINAEEAKNNWKTIDENSKHHDQLMSSMETLQDRLADVDDQFSEKLLGDGLVSSEDVQSALRRATLSRRAVTVCCGSALRVPMSVRMLLDAIVDYLPAPIERDHQLTQVSNGQLCALVYKISHDRRHGQLSYVRVYSGELKNNQMLYNVNRHKTEIGARVYIPHSDELQATDLVSSGNIAVITGLNSTVTGDTLFASEHEALEAAKRRHAILRPSSMVHPDEMHRSKRNDDLSTEEIDHLRNDSRISTQREFLLTGIDQPDPVYFCSIEPPSTGSGLQFDKALKELCVEDPSLRIRHDDCGQVILEGMGELHIEVVKERLKREYGLDVFMGPLQVGYREIVLGDGMRHTATIEEVFEQKKKHSCTITLEIESRMDAPRFEHVIVELDPSTSLQHARADWIKAVDQGCANALHNGPLLGFPVQGIMIRLRDLIPSGGRLNLSLISACARKCLEEALGQCEMAMLEPVMNVEVVIDGTDTLSLQGVLSEFSRRRAQIEHSEEGRVLARVPLAEMSGISRAIRTATGGYGHMHMELACYSRLSAEDQRAITNRYRTGRS